MKDDDRKIVEMMVRKEEARYEERFGYIKRESGNVARQLYSQDVLIKKQDKDLLDIQSKLREFDTKISILDHAIAKLQEVFNDKL